MRIQMYSVTVFVYLIIHTSFVLMLFLIHCLVLDMGVNCHLPGPAKCRNCKIINLQLMSCSHLLIPAVSS